jgi:type II restriction enzyme
MMPPNINSHVDLVTSRKAICEGFLAQAQSKREKATPFIDKAKQLWQKLQNTQNINSLISQNDLRTDLIAVSGFSEKSIKNLSAGEIDAAIKIFLAELSAKYPAQFREEILYRYLLTMGDALGGQMRNLTGNDASIKFTEALLAHLRSRQLSPDKKSKNSED